MKKYTDLEYLRLSKLKRFFYKIALFFVSIPGWFLNLFKKIGLFFKRFGIWVKDEVVDIVMTFKNGDWKTRVSYVVMGFGNFMRGQFGRGLLFFLFEAAFILYMVFWGSQWLIKFNTLGTQGPEYIYDEILDITYPIYHDNSFKIMLYSVLSIFFIIALIYTWRLNIKQNRIMEEILDTKGRREVEKQRKVALKEYHSSNSGSDSGSQVQERVDNVNAIYDEKIAALNQEDRLYPIYVRKLNKERKKELYYAKMEPNLAKIQREYDDKVNATGKPLRSTKDDIHSLIDDQFHKTLLALPLTGILVFTVMPIVFMILVAFTNYDGAHNGYSNNLFTWIGWENFNTLLGWKGGANKYSAAFGEILAWTLIWAFLATFTNYFLGMFVAIMINKKGIRLKKVWRTILVLTIAIPQFISLMYVSKMFADNGFIIAFLRSAFHVPESFSFIGSNANEWVARATVVVINIWIGIPYLMLIATGILMNIPADLYESAKIDGANVWQQYTKITLPYMIFITGPYLLTSFIGNMNNFNVIYLLTGGGPANVKYGSVSGGVGYTDLLITWLFKLTTGTESKYYMGSVIGILVFVVVAVLSLIVYNIMPSTRNEEDYQ